MDFLIAVQLLTSIPVRVGRACGADRLGRATAWFPVVGLIIGIILAGAHWLLSLFLPAGFTNILIIGILVMLTGGMHLDGLSDTCDGMAGYRPVEERWKIMHDSHTGAFGVVGIVMVLLAKYAALNSVPAGCVRGALVLMPVISRWAMVYAIYTFKYAHPDGMGAAYKQATGAKQLVIASIITLVVAAVLIPWFSFFTGFIAIAGTWLTTTLLALYFRHKFAGLTGDTYGAINELGELAVLFWLVVVL